MILTLRKSYAKIITSGVYVLLFVVMVQTNSRTVRIVCISLVMVNSLFAWVSTWQRRRMIIDTPTSRIASAAQGYVELQGEGLPLEDTPLFSHLTALPCLWYRWQVREKTDNNKWVMVSSGESETSFIINDGSGRCIIDVEGAEILTKHKDTWRQGNYSCTEWKLLNNEQIYALGEFQTVSSVSAELNISRDLGNLLREWKKDRNTLLERFDNNNDGEISEQEWELARKAARHEINQIHREARNSSGMHTLSHPGSGRHYILSNINPNLLTRRYWLWSLFHLAAFLAALAAIYLMR